MANIKQLLMRHAAIEQDIERAQATIEALQPALVEVAEEIRSITGCDCLALGIECNGHG